MTGFNLSEWALNHRSFVWYLMLALRWPASWPTASSAARKTRPSPSRPWSSRPRGRARPSTTRSQQVTDRIEKKLEEVPYLDYVKSYTKPGESDRLRQSARTRDAAGGVPDLWYQVRKKIADIKQHPAAGHPVGPFFNDEFGDTFGIIYAFTADGFSHRELRDYAEARARRDCCACPTSARSQLRRRRRTRRSISNSRPSSSPALGIDRQTHDRRRCRRRTRSRRRASVEAGAGANRGPGLRRVHAPRRA